MATPQYVFQMDGLTKAFPGGKKVFENIWLSFLPEVKIGVVGVNGSGKSSLLNIMAGLDKDFPGEAWAADGVNVGYLPQEPELDPALDVRGNVMEARREARLLERYNDVAIKVGEDYSDELMEEMTTLQEKIDARRPLGHRQPGRDGDGRAPLPARRRLVDTLSGGEKRRVALCRLLLEKPDMLLLDEPTNHLDAETVAWLQQHLNEYPGTVIVVTHDRYFLDDVTGWILELDRGRGIPYEGNYSAWLEQKPSASLQEAREDKARQQTLTRELEWIRQAPRPARPSRRPASPPTTRWPRRSEREKIADRPDRHPARPAPRQQRHRGREPREGLRRHAS